MACFCTGVILSVVLAVWFRLDTLRAIDAGAVCFASLCILVSSSSAVPNRAYVVAKAAAAWKYVRTTRVASPTIHGKAGTVKYPIVDPDKPAVDVPCGVPGRMESPQGSRIAVPAMRRQATSAKIAPADALQALAAGDTTMQIPISMHNAIFIQEHVQLDRNER